MALSPTEIRAILETANWWKSGFAWGQVGTGL